MMKGLYKKYNVQKADGTPTDPQAIYFVLRLDTDSAARLAIGTTYVHACQKDDPQLASDLLDLLQAIEHHKANGMSAKPHILFKPIYEGYLGCHPKMRWNRVLEALSALNEVYYSRGAKSEETQDALQTLMEAYDKWLDGD